MPLYEIMCVLRAGAEAPALTSMFKRAATKVTERGGIIKSLENLGVRPLAQRMKAHQQYHTEGRYVRLFTYASPEALKEIEHVLRINEDVIRWLTVSRKQVPRQPQKMKRMSLWGYSPEYYELLRQENQLDWKATIALIREGKLSSDELKERVHAILPKRNTETVTDKVNEIEE